MPPRDAGLETFSVLWAFAILTHQVGYLVVGASVLDAALTIAALGVMVFPTPLMLAGLSALHVATVTQHLPAVYNHWFFAALVSLLIVLGLGAAWWRSRRGREPVDPSRIVPSLRWSLLLIYFLSGFHKLNSDFFDTAVSCAPILYDQMTARIPGLSAAPVDPLVIAITLLVELGTPLLLLTPRFRKAGVVVGIVFHLGMAEAGYARFSATGMALLSLFLLSPPSFRAPLRIAIVAVFVPAVALAGRGGEALFFWCTMLLGAGGLAYLLLDRERAPSFTGGRLGVVGITVLALMVLSGAAPYLGLWTDRAFAMYSNLRTEGGESNHFLLPAGAQLFATQRDLIQVLASNRPRLQRLAERQQVVPYPEFRARLTEEMRSSDSAVAVRYIHRGETHDVASVAADARLGEPVSWLRVKLFRYRPIEIAGPRRCSA